VVNGTHGSGAGAADKADKTVTYFGKAVSVSL